MENISILKQEYKTKKIVFITFVTIMAMMILLGCASAISYDGPYEGRVIDADTGEPIEGVVVLGKWSKEYITPGGAVHEYYDAIEKVTDKNGEFSIPGQGLLIASNVTPMDVLIFKAGYEYIGYVPWSSLKKGLFLSKKIKWEGNKAIIPLRKLTIEEMRKRGSPPDPPTRAEFEKVRKMLKEIDEDRLKRGLDTRHTWRGKEI